MCIIPNKYNTLNSFECKFFKAKVVASITWNSVRWFGKHVNPPKMETASVLGHWNKHRHMSIDILI